MSSPDKNLSIVEGDIVRVAVGRGWRRAKVLKKLSDGLLQVLVKGKGKTVISPEHVMTDEETKSFSKSHGHTKIIRNGNDEILGASNQEEEEEEVKSQSFTSKLFGGKL